MSNFSEGNDFEDILARLLENVDASLDKRQGSIIYDALAPAAAELAQCYIALDIFSDQTYLLEAVDENLDNRVADYGLIRRQATNSRVEIKIYNTSNELMDLEDLSARFSTPNEFGGYNFSLIERTDIGTYIAECETAGSAGNEYIGELLPLVSINNLGKAEIDTIYKPGEDEETDEELRQRALTKINQEAFAGNKASYKQFVADIDGVEKSKVFPVWNGGGTVKIAIVAANNTIPTQTFIDKVQNDIDPIQNQGQGLGIAPIGHSVTVVAPDRLDINIEATITISEGYTKDELQTSIEQKIKEYLEEVQEKWEDANDLIIYSSKIIAAILGVSQVQNVSNLTINGQSGDLTISITGTNVKFPIFNEVILNEN